MKLPITILFSIIILVACTEKNNFEYKGEYPDWAYMSLYNSKNIEHIDASDTTLIKYRNRIYITIDTSLNILLNNHIVTIEEFEKCFKFIYTNPKKLSHLPESPQEVVVLYAYNIYPRDETEKNISLIEKKKLIDVGQVELKMVTAIQDIQENYVRNSLGIQLSEISNSQQIDIEKKFPLNIAMYTNMLEHGNRKLNRGVISKLMSKEEKGEQLSNQTIIKVRIDKENEIYLDGITTNIEELTDSINNIILNNKNNFEFEKADGQVYISLNYEDGTDYDKYLEVYNAMKDVYTKLWEAESQNTYGRPFESLEKIEKRKIKSEIPFLITENESTDFD